MRLRKRDAGVHSRLTPLEACPSESLPWRLDIGLQKTDERKEIKRTDLLLEWAVQHGEDEEAERLREKLRKLTEM